MHVAAIAFALLHQAEPFHGVWIANVGSTAMRSEKDVREAVSLCRKKGINTLFVVVWNNGMTTYPSKVFERAIGVRQDPRYKGFDPLAAFVQEGHRAKLKVHAWFEYGFSYQFGSAPSPWTKLHPEWIGRDAAGKPLMKNGFAWWNSLHPGPQQFLQDLMLEVVRKYKVDGVQGDDRLPAMPSEGGYEPETLARFSAETGASGTPDSRDPKWVQWRADQLSTYAQRLYRAVKRQRKDCLVSWAPSIFPWSKEEYLQDWPTWLRGGYADFVIPQVYRYDFKSYEATLQDLRSQLSVRDLARVYPGMLTSLGAGYRIDPELFARQQELNKRLGFQGECLFYFEGLRSGTP